MYRYLDRYTRSFLRIAQRRGPPRRLIKLPIVDVGGPHHANSACCGMFLISLHERARGVAREIGEKV
ncbi:hypothetical protein DPMN_155299 [Dreissena polymorpha]|uniref:Uncharacterized protein n=1 Tax=Dreissena polymorpha TaxID=45954 RepID=A0A9D4FRJ0_DREPO|nr:hypothetical protein DPMN_155299 [Dreissena polymorpha]